MNKPLITLVVAVLLICVTLSGCEELEEDSDKESVHIVWEAVAEVHNSSGAPVTGIEVEFKFGKYPKYEDESRYTDTTGWTGFVVKVVM